MKKTLLFLLCLTLTGSLFAQQDIQKSLSLSWGFGNLQKQDLTFSPMIHRDWSPLNVVVEYQRSKKIEQSLLIKFSQYQAIIGEQFEFNSFYEEGIQSTYPHLFSLLDINYSIRDQIVEKENWNLAIGARSRNRLLPTVYNFGNFNSLGYYFSFGLDFTLDASLKIDDRQQITSGIAVPLFFYNARTDYLWHTDPYLAQNYSHNGFKAFWEYLKDGEFQLWDKAQSVDFYTQYFYSINEKWEIGGRYALSMNFNQAPTPFNQIENTFYLSGKLKF